MSWPPVVSEVRAEDGTPLHVTFDGRADATTTVLFTHGFTASSEEWVTQRPALNERARLVFWDHRGHGQSGWTKLTKATIEQTARDLEAVIDRLEPGPPLVLAGHSMGGMTIMALARRRPDLFGSLVQGVFLLCTSAGGLVEKGPLAWWVKLLRRLGLLALWLRVLQLFAPLLERGRRRGTKAGRRFIRHYLFGRHDATPAMVDQVQELLERTPWTVTAAYYATFLEHHEEAALPTLGRVPVTIVGAQYDRLTPAAHSRRMAELIGPSAQLTIVPGAGHSVNLTRPEIVNRAFTELLDRVERQARAA